MTWTKDTPTVLGHYWVAFNLTGIRLTYMAKIDEFENGVLKAVAMGNEARTPLSAFQSKDVYWYGPIPVPPLEVAQ